MTAVLQNQIYPKILHLELLGNIYAINKLINDLYIAIGLKYLTIASYRAIFVPFLTATKSNRDYFDLMSIEKFLMV